MGVVDISHFRFVFKQSSEGETIDSLTVQWLLMGPLLSSTSALLEKCFAKGVLSLRLIIICRKSG